MLDLLFLLGGFLAGLVVYKCWEWRDNRKREERGAAREEAEQPAEAAGRGAGAQVCLEMIEATFTNNRYDPMGDVFSELSPERVEGILGVPLKVDMGGYMP